MLKNLCLLALILTFVLGCGYLSTGEKTETGQTAPADSKKIGLGDTVVARWSGNSFYEGQVQTIDGGKITIGWEDGSSPTKVDESDVYPLPKVGAKPDVAVGDMVLAKVGSSTYWNGAEITKIDGEVYAVKTVENAESANVDANKIIKISPATASNLKEKAGSTDFLKDATSKKPTIPSDYKPKVGDKVLAQWAANSWWSGKVTKVVGDKTTIAWEDGSKPSAVDRGSVMAYPDPAGAKMPSEGQFVLAKPVSGSKWVYAQTVAVKDKSIEVKHASGDTRTVKIGEFVLLN
ncbi:MAG: DUF4537 domain-containing protein [Pyrinomonadaceae bacterium]|nr:DUF4537 domain-containing protein [Pyrinomonadaceae bacterium]